MPKRENPARAAPEMKGQRDELLNTPENQAITASPAFNAAHQHHAPRPITPDLVRQMQNTHGNAYVQRFLRQNYTTSAPSIQRASFINDKWVYELGDIVLYDGKLHIVVKIGEANEQDHDQSEYDVADAQDNRFNVRGSELTRQPEAVWNGAIPEELEGIIEPPQNQPPQQQVPQQPQRGSGTTFAWNAGEAAPPQEVNAGFWQNEMPGVKSANRRQVTNPGDTPLGQTPVPGGHAWASHNVDFIKQGNNGPVKQTGGFTFNYEGATENAAQSQWIQFISIKMIETVDNQDRPVNDGDARVQFTISDDDPQYGVDYSENNSPFYPPSFKTETEQQTRTHMAMVDDPLPSVGTIRERIEQGATRIVETDTFDTFLIQNGQVVYHGKLRVIFTCDASQNVQDHPITKHSEIMSSAAANSLPQKMRETLHQRYPQFNQII